MPAIPLPKESEEAFATVVEQLVSADDVHFPATVVQQGGCSTLEEKREHLTSLLHRDPYVFLERHERFLSLEQLGHFEVLLSDEVQYLVRKLQSERTRSAAAVSVQDRRERARRKNRRLAHLRDLERGDFFSEDSMRHRAPLLHHHYVGMYDPEDYNQPASARSHTETMMNWCQERETAHRLEREKQREEETMEEFDSTTDEDEDDVDEGEGMRGVEAPGEATRPAEGGGDAARESMGTAGPAGEEGQEGGPRGLALDRNWFEARLEKVEELTRVMKERFLSGGDAEFVDYTAIDANAQLDNHWRREYDQDAEDAYFDESDPDDS